MYPSRATHGRQGAMNTKPDPLPSDSEIVFAPARDLVRWLTERRLGAEELMSRFLARIDEVNPAVNAIVTLAPEAALEDARAADAALARGEPPGAAPRTADRGQGPDPDARHPHHVRLADLPRLRSRGDALYVERLKAAGAIVIGKTNTPEFGAGSQTFNRVFGATKNPYATGRTCGGSSGGAAVAVACGMLPPRGRDGHGRLAPQPRLVGQRRRLSHLAGAGAGVAAQHALQPARGRRPHRAARGGRGPAALCDGRPRPARAALHRGAGARGSASRWSAISRVSGSRGARPWAATRWSRRCSRCAAERPPGLRSSAARSRRRTRTFATRTRSSRPCGRSPLRWPRGAPAPAP